MTDTNWWKSAVFYQIYPRSFFDTTGNGVGDLNGITEKLQYVADLGVDSIWISPFLQSPMKDFGYDISDYREIDPLFGNINDFEKLIDTAHNLKLKIIMDMVLSHTSDQHEWFVESASSKDNPKADWYVWVDDDEDGNPPNNWVSVFGGSAWEWHEGRQQFYLHNFLKEQPDLNFHNDDVQKAVIGECRFWIEKGIDGFRMDAINYCVHDYELRDNPPRDPLKEGWATQFEQPDPYSEQWHVYDKSRPEAIQFIERFRDMMNDFPHAMTVAEVGDDNDIQVAADYTKENTRFHTAYNFSLLTGNKITASKIRNILESQQDKGADSWPSWAFSNHDVIRPVTRWGENIKDKQAFAKMLNALILCLRGTIFIYQGEELGLTDAEIPFEKLQDPWGKHLWPKWQGRDGCRTPMPWNNTEDHAGFSTTTNDTWLPIPEDHKLNAVSIQENNPESVLNNARTLLKQRKSMPALQTGDTEFLETGDDKILAFYRMKNDQKILCIFNLCEDEKTYNDIKLSALEYHIQEV